MVMQPMRDRISLNGTWRFQPTPGAAYNDPALAPQPLTEPRLIAVPGCIQAQFDDLRDYADVSVYERTFAIPTEWGGRAVRLCFGAVDYLAEVWVDGEYVGNHEGMFLPFTLDITHLVKYGHEHKLTIRVTDPGGAAWPEREYRQFPDISFREAPHGKQSWYGSIGGIWQEVWLEAGSPVYIYRALATPLPEQEEARFRVILAGPQGPYSPKAAPTSTRLAGQGAAGHRAPGPVPTPSLPNGRYSVVVRVKGPDGTTYTSAPVPVEDGEAQASVCIPDPALWDLEHPNLYDFSVILLQGIEPVDLFEDYFGMRTVAAKGNRIYLNGKPLYLRAALDQDYYPTTLWTPPSDAFLKDQVVLAKELGLNMLRCHIKTPHPRYLYWADKLGLLVWEEYGNSSNSQGRAPQLCQATLEGLIERDFNHPATIIWSIINEAWGIDMKEQRDRDWLLQMYPHFKAYDPTRLVTDNSACPGNFHMASDLADYHSYYAYPDHFAQWEGWVADLASRPKWLWSAHGDAKPTGEEPLLNSEFGNWGLPDANDLLDEQGREPWWFATGSTWNDGVVFPQHVRERYAASALPRAFGSYKDFVTATQVQQFRAFKHEIEAMRQHASLNGYVITEFTDLHWECNGLVNQNRQPKAGHDLYQTVIAGTQLIARPVAGRWGFAPGEAVAVKVQVASDSSAGATDYRVRWWLETGVTTPLPARGAVPAVGAVQGELGGVTLPTFGVSDAGEIAFAAPDGGAQRLRLHLVLLDALNREVCRGFEDFAVFAPVHAGGSAVWLAADLSHLADPLRALGYDVSDTTRPAGGQVAVVAKLDEVASSFAQGGGRVLLLAAGPDALTPTGSPLRIVDRKDGQWHGDWASGWHWLQPGLLGASEGALENPLDLPWAGVLPDHVILGYSEEQQADWLAGYVLGWVRLPAATAAGFRLGDGAVLATTFRLAQTLGQHPAAGALLGALIARVSDHAYRPATTGGPEEGN